MSFLMQLIKMKIIPSTYLRFYVYQFQQLSSVCETSVTIFNEFSVLEFVVLTNSTS